MLSAEKAVRQARVLKGYAESERLQLDAVRRYWKGRQKLPATIPSTSPPAVKSLARIARVNVLEIVVDALAQSLFVDGFRAKGDDENSAVWDVWQANKLDARQSGIHRAAVAYGTAYAVVTPGLPFPVIRGVSPRAMTAMYGEDPDWPIFALERFGKDTWRLYDEGSVYFLTGSGTDGKDFQFIEAREHGAGVTPVIRYVDSDDLDEDDEPAAETNDRYWEPMPTRGQVAPLASIQDQIDLTTFGLLVAQHYAAFRQRYVIGWVPDDEQQLLKASASALWTFEDTGEGPEGVKVGEFGQTDLSGYIESRESSMRHAATLSQTPVHELIGELVNLSAEALTAAEAGRDRKVDERKTLMGEAHEQTLRLAGRLASIDVPVDAQVVWRDTSARAFSAVVDALGKLVTMLGIPPQELWEKVPGATQQDVERWKAAAETGDAFKQLAEIIDRQSKTPQPAPPAPPQG